MRATDPDDVSLRKGDSGAASVLRAVSLIAAVVAGLGSLALMFRAGERTPRFLLFAFVLWVLFPFAVLLWANRRSTTWLPLTRATLHMVTLIIAIASLAIYGDLIHVKPAGSPNAFLWVIVPPASCLFIAIAGLLAAFVARRRAAALTVVASLAALTGTASSANGQEQEQPPLPAPGRLIDVGGWRLHLNCTGEPRAGQPTVILEAGKGDFSVEWSLVQPGVAAFARVCSYDRGGDGWSDMGPHPRTMQQLVYELHTLLDKAGERPPFVLVGHSYGGWLVRVYQATHPSEVAAIVLVDAGANDPLRYLPDGTVGRSSAMVTGQPVPAVKTANPLRVSDIPPGALNQMRAGLTAASATANEPPRDKLPPAAQQMRTWALGQLGHVAAAVNPVENEELALLRADLAKAEAPLGDLPLLVITRGRLDEEGPDAESRERDHRSDQASMVKMSRSGTHVIAARSGHHVHLEEPDLVISTLRELLAQLHR